MADLVVEQMLDVEVFQAGQGPGCDPAVFTMVEAGLPRTPFSHAPTRGCSRQFLSKIISMLPTHESLASAGHEDDGDDFEALLNHRESEMDQDPSQEISHQEFLAHFEVRRQRRPTQQNGAVGSRSGFLSP